MKENIIKRGIDFLIITLLVTIIFCTYFFMGDKTKEVKTVKEENVEEKVEQEEDIDLESDLPGKEWIATFQEVVNEPLFVVFNDETNKKVVARDGESLQYEKGDTFVVYTPTGSWIISDSGMPIIEFKNISGYYNEFDFDMYYVQTKKKFTVEVKQNGEKKEVSCIVEPVL